MYGDNNQAASSSNKAQKRKSDQLNTTQNPEPAKRKRDAENNATWTTFKQDWWAYVNSGELEVKNKRPEALIRFNYRYVVSDNTGALKYEPAVVDQILNRSRELERVYYRRQINDQSPRQTRQQSQNASLPTASHFEERIAPQSSTGTALIVPSVGMPQQFLIKEKLQELYWYTEGTSRPVYLFVHQSELALYDEQMGAYLRDAGVGLVGWEFESGTVGFGATRKAVVDFCKQNQFKKVTMMDCNVLMSDMDLISAAEQATSKVKDDTTLYFSLGSTSGDTYEKGSEAPKQTMVESDNVRGRPIEQFTMLNTNVLFDPAFISSSEDIDVSNDMKFFESINKDKSIEFKELKLKLQDAQKIQYPRINKLRLNATSDIYNEKFKEHLTQIANKEKDLVVQVQTDMGKGTEKKFHNVTIQTLSEFIAQKLGKDALRIQSLIIEKILVKYKNMSIGKGYKYTPEGLEETQAALFPENDSADNNR
ncbi:hypothetical protein HB761_13065 [Vibrio campbellii]|uniref:Uncharacterized protein n=1 Tax=Vibrio campbellii TaxID=680 RepID=A0AAE9N0P2_9VIBR|nr:hypothetical protein [Vibrio campbellii]UTZ27598.1 hypothetical protein HB761_13065 [Vibrio campbellii]